MGHFHYHNNTLHTEQVPLNDIATQFGTPCYITSKTTLVNNWQAFDQALAQQPHLICYAVKANSNLSILSVLAKLGSGFDVVSIGELERVIAAGGNPKQVVFSGVGKQEHEIKKALEVNVLSINVESIPELHLINNIAKKLELKAPISIRVNPNIDAKTHPYIATGLRGNKFGIDFNQALEAYLIAADLPNINIIGIDCHIGSQITELNPFIQALNEIKKLMTTLNDHGINIKHLNMGGGLGVQYQEESPPTPEQYVQALIKTLDNPKISIILEPGRAITANAGILLTQVLSLKKTPKKNFAIVDAAMNDLIGPALYQRWHQIIPIKQAHENSPTENYDIVGPVCESGDFLGKDRDLNLNPDDLLAICNTGAYVNCMASNYNTRPRAAEVMIEKDKITLIKPRETIQDLLNSEKEALENSNL